MYIIKAGKWDVNKNLDITKSSRLHEYEFRSDTVKGAMRKYRDMLDHNDMTKFSPLKIYDVVNTAE